MIYRCWIMDALTEEYCDNHKDFDSFDDAECWGKETISGDPAFTYDITDENDVSLF